MTDPTAGVESSTDEPSPPAGPRLPTAADRLLRRAMALVGLESGDEAPSVEPGLAKHMHNEPGTLPGVGSDPETHPDPARRTTVGDNATAAMSVGGRRGVDYEIVSKRRGPGTWGALLFLVLLGVIAWTAGSRAYRWVAEQLDPPGDPTHEVVLTLPLGSSTASISELLAASDVIASSRAYEWYVRLKGGPAFQAGEYTFQANSSVWETIEVLSAGPTRVAQATQRRITVPEGLTVAEMAKLFDESPGLSFSGEEFLDAVHARPNLSAIAPAPVTLPDGVIERSEGQLFADTYFVDADTSAEQFVTLMVERFDAVLNELEFRDAPQRVGLTPYEALIVASIIEREAQRPQDRARVARVIYNRLEQGWSLGVDATIVYAVGTSELTVDLLAVDSPYNTRLFIGLPPTPIAAPGRASLEAALDPARGEWMFFVLTAPDGTLSFSVNIEDFQRDKAVCVELGLCG